MSRCDLDAAASDQSVGRRDSAPWRGIAGAGRVGLLGITALLAACSGFSWLPLVRSMSTETIRVEAEAGINNDHPLAVDVVYADTEVAMKRLTDLKAAEYFSQTEQLRRDFPTGLTIQRWEIVPGQSLPPQEVPKPGRGAIAAFVYVGYLAPGIHRARIDVLEHAAIHLGPKSFSVYEAPPP